jgi:hypothetical protein
MARLDAGTIHEPLDEGRALGGEEPAQAAGRDLLVDDVRWEGRDASGHVGSGMRSEAHALSF